MRRNQNLARIEETLGWRTAFALAATLLLGIAELAAQEIDSGAKAVHELLEQRCFKCHGQNGTAKADVFVLDHARLLDRKTVVPGDEKSTLLRVVAEGEMPPRDPKLTADELKILRDWILGGAPSWEPKKKAAPPAFTPEGMLLDAIVADLEKADERSRRFLRYYSLAHLQNAGLPKEELSLLRTGLAKLLNSLSWRKEIAIPKPIDAAQTLLRIDLRDFEWTLETWGAVLAYYPYGVQMSGFERVRVLSGAEVPYLRADWFVANAALPPLYHEILGLPTTLAELERKLGVDSSRNLDSERCVRAGIRKSGVSRNNRAIERHESSHGAYWKSFDYDSSTGDKSVFRNPLELRAAGGEMIFNLPNGFQAYFITDPDGKRLDEAPVSIVSDPENPDGAVVRTGLSCMACHYGGIKSFQDDVRPMLESMTAAPFDREKALAIYAPKETMGGFIRKDSERYLNAVVAAGGEAARGRGAEPVNALAVRFQSELTPAVAAAEAGLELSAFRHRVERSTRLMALSYGQLLSEHGGMKRDLWEEQFPVLVAELRLGGFRAPSGGTRTTASPAPAPAPSPVTTAATTVTGVAAFSGQWTFTGSEMNDSGQRTLSIDLLTLAADGSNAMLVTETFALTPNGNLHVGHVEARFSGVATQKGFELRGTSSETSDFVGGTCEKKDITAVGISLRREGDALMISVPALNLGQEDRYTRPGAERGNRPSDFAGSWTGFQAGFQNDGSLVQQRWTVIVTVSAAAEVRATERATERILTNGTWVDGEIVTTEYTGRVVNGTMQLETSRYVMTDPKTNVSRNVDMTGTRLTCTLQDGLLVGTGVAQGTSSYGFLGSRP